MKWQDKHDSLKQKAQYKRSKFYLLEMFRNGDFFANTKKQDRKLSTSFG